MNTHTTPTTHAAQRPPTGRAGERGAALITVLLLSTLLLTAGGTLILTTSLTSSSSFDAVSELQAYEAAEAGLQEAMTVLRGNVAPSPLVFTGGGSSAVVNQQNKLDFRRAVTRLNSNKPTDPATAGGAPVPLRLSRWLPYNYTRPGSSYPDRVTLNPAGTVFNPFVHSSYSVEVIDPEFPTPADITAKLATDPLYMPNRLMIQATGYGPKGARKQLRTIVTRLFFNIQSPSPIVIRGADDGTPMSTFETGNSNSKKYSGQDQTYPTQPNKPAIAISLHDWTKVDAGITKGSTLANPKLGILDLDVVPNVPPVNLDPVWPATLTPVPAVKPPSVATPYFIQTAEAARAFVDEARELAKEMGRYYTGAQFASQLGGVAEDTGDAGYTFVEGDITLNGGTGLLIVTGRVTIDGNDSFQGIVLALGAGEVYRNGGGGGETLGTWIVARFNNTGGFLAPSWDTSGGGNSEFLFDTASINTANAQAGRRTLGVMER